MRTQQIDPERAQHYTRLFQGALADQVSPVDVSYVDGVRFWIEVGETGTVYRLSPSARESSAEHTDVDEVLLMLQHVHAEGVLG